MVKTEHKCYNMTRCVMTISAILTSVILFFIAFGFTVQKLLMFTTVIDQRTNRLFTRTVRVYKMMVDERMFQRIFVC
jgi:hypothetical protein